MMPRSRMTTFWLAIGGMVLSLADLATVAAAPKPIYRSPIIDRNTPGYAIDVDIELPAAKELWLVVTDGGDGFSCDWADWVNPRIITSQGERKLTELNWKAATSEWGEVRKQANANGGALRINGQAIADGIGTHANSLIGFDLPAGAQRFRARVGLDNGGTDQGAGSVEFLVFVEKPELKARSGQVGHEPDQAVEGLEAGDGLEATLFAAEPMLLSPADIDVDHLGRVWVSEVVNYRGRNGQRPEGDRILVLEDTNGDGVADKQTVFYQGRDIDSALGVCVLPTPSGKGTKVIVSVAPNVLILHDDDGDLKADRKEVLFTKTGDAQHDHSAHAFVFGPDGRFYWNFGNTGHTVHDKDGKPIVDRAGKVVNDLGKPYRQGMVFRCNLDGSEFEVLGNNFRNNYEVCVDSFGTLWQSDNDDDGNRGVRINYVMEYGNFGYVDEMTGAGWQTPRTNMEAEIPLRHWHLNDPGVVPNLLQTGAGSPTGICLYEGDLLPPVFRNQIIHCDAGPNIVRAYPVKEAGAGYTASMVRVLEGTKDKWFRPSDVCVAPDGSLIIADWYDPGVGGHAMGDKDKGRLFRIAPPNTKYRTPPVDVSTPAGAVAALKSPNLATRYLGWQALMEQGAAAEETVSRVFQFDPNPRMRARALWWLVRWNDRPERIASQIRTIVKAMEDPDPQLHVTAIRAARLAGWTGADRELSPAGQALLNQVQTMLAAEWNQLRDREPKSVLRELAIAVRHSKLSTAPDRWASLAERHDGQDRWYLEALGIGADGNWDACLTAYTKLVSNPLASKAGRDILWRSRATESPVWLERMITAEVTPLDEVPRCFRAFDFLTGDGKEQAIRRLAFDSGVTHPARLRLIQQEAIARVQAFDVRQDPAKLAALNRALTQVEGTPEFVTLVERFGLDEQLPKLVRIATSDADFSTSIAAAKLLLAKAQPLIRQVLDGDKADAALAMVRALGNTLDGRAAPILDGLVFDAERALPLRQEAIRGIARSKPGLQKLLQLGSEKKLDEALLPAVAAAVHGAPLDDGLRKWANEVFPLPPGRNDKPLPPIAQLVQTRGDANRGKTVFSTEIPGVGGGLCARCHVVSNQGKDIGPNLTEIGSKLSREALFESILFPSAGISHNFETWIVALNNGTVINGIKVTETPTTLTLKGADAVVREINKSEIDDLKKSAVSLMPADLQKTMTAEELIDVVEYLQTLKKP